MSSDFGEIYVNNTQSFVFSINHEDGSMNGEAPAFQEFVS